MSWEIVSESEVRVSTQVRFRITSEILNFFSDEHLQAMRENDESGTYCNIDVGASLLAAMQDDLSISDLESIVKAFNMEYLVRRVKQNGVV